MFVPESDCTASFVVCGDDGYRLFVDGEEVFADWATRQRDDPQGECRNESRPEIRAAVEYFDNASSAAGSSAI